MRLLAFRHTKLYEMWLRAQLNSSNVENVNECRGKRGCIDTMGCSRGEVEANRSNREDAQQCQRAPVELYGSGAIRARYHCWTGAKTDRKETGGDNNSREAEIEVEASSRQGYGQGRGNGKLDCNAFCRAPWVFWQRKQSRIEEQTNQEKEKWFDSLTEQGTKRAGE